MANADCNLERRCRVGAVVEQERAVGDRDHVLAAFLGDAKLEPLQLFDRPRRREALEQRRAGGVERVTRHRDEHPGGCEEIDELHDTLPGSVTPRLHAGFEQLDEIHRPLGNAHAGGLERLDLLGGGAR